MKRKDPPICEFGSNCYRKNPYHRKKFYHSDVVKSPKKDLPDDSDDVNKQTSVSDNSKRKISNDKKGKDQTKQNENSGKEIKKKTIDNEGTSSGNQTFHKTFPETVDEILKSMPKDFFDFWKFCSSLNKSKPEEAFSELGFHLVGIYDLLSKNISSDETVDLLCHWRYYYDPPEFQTVVKHDGKDLYHLGYFRDDPKELPSILASNSARIGPQLTLKGDNIFAAMNYEIKEAIKKSKCPKMNEKFNKVLNKLKLFANKNKYSLDLQTSITKARSKKVVAKTFHGLGIVVPLVNDIGYRPLPDSNAIIKNILKRITSAENEDKKLEEEESLDELITNVQFANDECDYGMGLELGIDLFCFGHIYFHSHILHILPLAYELLKRPKYAEIVRVHLKNRKLSDNLAALKL